MNRFSKSLAMLLAVLMMFSCFAFTASAADSGEFYFTDASGKAGEEVTISLVNKTAINLVSASVKFDYDTTALQLVSYTDTKNFPGGNDMPTMEAGFKWFTWANDSSTVDIALPAETVMGTLTFKILDGAAAGDYTVTPSVPFDSTYDVGLDNLDITCTAGTITVAKEAQTVNAPYFVRNAATIAAATDIAAGGYEQGKPSFGWDYTNGYAFARVAGNTGKNFYLNSYSMGSVEFPDESWYTVIFRINLDGKKSQLFNRQDATGSTVTEVKNDTLTADTWTKAVFKITKGTKDSQDIFKQLSFYPFGFPGLSDEEYAAGAYFDVAAWGLFKDEYSALNYEFPVVTEGITVTWKDGDTVLETTGTNKKSTVSAIAMPTKEGFTFSGWSTAVDGTALTDDEIAAITEDTTLYALWTALGENTYTVKYLNYDDTEIASYAVAENAMIDDNIPADPTRVRDAAYWYGFKNWTLDGAAVTKDAIALMTVTDNITFKADYTATAHINPLVQKKKFGLVNPTGKTSGGFAITEETYKGYSAYKYAPLAELEEGKVSAALHLEGYDNTPVNYSSLTGIKTAYDARIYKSIAVRYYYEPGANTTARNIKWASMPLNGETVPLVQVPMTSGKWTYAIFNFDQSALAGMTYASCRQFHLRLIADVQYNAYAEGEMLYLDNVRWFLDTPNVYTVKFNDGTNDIYEMDALEGETVVYGGEALTAPEGTEFLGWTTTNGSTEVTALTISDNTTFYPVFGVKENVVYVSAQGDDANNGIAPATAVKTLKKAIELAAAMAPTAGTSATVVVCGEGAVSGNIANLNVNTGMITITSKYKENDYTDKARVYVLTGTLKNTTTAFLKFENIVFAGLTTGNGWNFLNAMNNYFAFGEGITSDNTAEGIKQSEIKFRAGGENGSVDYDKFGGLPLVFTPNMTVHLASKLAYNTNNIYAIIGKEVKSINAGNDGGDKNGTLSGYTRIEVNGAQLTGVGMNNISGNNAHYAIIFNDGAKVVTPTVKASNDGNTYKTFVLAGSEGYIFHHNADVSKVGEFTVEAYPAGKTYYLANGAEFDPATAFAGNALVLAESGTYNYDYADYKVTFKYDETTSVKYGKVGTAVVFDGTVTAPEHKTLAGWAVEGTEDIVDLATLTADTTLVPVFGNTIYTVMFGEIEVTGAYGEIKKAPEGPAATEEGKVFDVWANVADETDTIAAGEDFEIAGDAEYAATWKDANFDVVFTDGETFTDKAAGDVITVPAYTGTVPDGKDFVEWKLVGGEKTLSVGAEYTLVGAETFEAVFADHVYTVMFGTIEVKGALGAEKNAPEAPTAEEGKEFAGWKNTASGEVLAAGAAFTIAGNAEYEATWNTLKFTVIFDEAATNDVEYGSTINAPAFTGTAPEGKEFAGWKNTATDEIVAADADIVVKSNLTFESTFSAIKVEVIIEGAPSNIELGSEITLPAAPTTVPAGKKFVGWSTTEGGKVEYAAGAAYTVNGAVTFYPVYVNETEAIYYGEATYTVHSGSYVVDLYVSGAKINVAAFGVKYPDSLELVSFDYNDAAVEKFAIVDYSVNDTANGIYADLFVAKGAQAGLSYVVDATATPVKVGTFVFRVVDKAAFEALTSLERFGNAVLDASFADGKYFDAVSGTTLYTPMDEDDPLAGGNNLPVSIRYVTENVVTKTVTVTGKYVATDRLSAAEANLKKATLKIYDDTDALVNTVTLDETVDDIETAYSVDLAPGTYKFVFTKTAYLTVKVDVTVPDNVDDMVADTAIAYAGDIYDTQEMKKNEKVDIFDFVRVIRGLDTTVSASADYIREADTTEDGAITIDDIAVITKNFEKTGYEG